MLSIILLLFFLIFECRKKQQISNCRNPLKSSTICLFNVYISCSNQPEFIISINLNVVHASVIFALYSFITRIIILALLNLINPIQFSSFSLNASLKFGFLHKILNQCHSLSYSHSITFLVNSYECICLFCQSFSSLKVENMSCSLLYIHL